MRPCRHDNSTEGCPICLSWDTDSAYREYWTKRPQAHALARKALNFVMAVGKAAVNNFALVSKEEVRRRVAICRGCELFDAVKSQCTHEKCGCFVKFKARLESEHCPIKKW